MHLIIRNVNVLVKSCLTGENQLSHEYTHLLRKPPHDVFSRTPRNEILRLQREAANQRVVANLPRLPPDDDDSDEEAEEDDEDSVCSDDGGLGWDDEPDMTSSTEAEKKKRRKEKADRMFINRTVCHLTRADPGDEEFFERVALPAAYHYITHNRSGEKMSRT